MIEILKLDNNSDYDIERRMKNYCEGVEIFEKEDFTEHFYSYMDAFSLDPQDEDDQEEIAKFQKMVNEGITPDDDWSVVEYEEKTYYISYHC